jgi:hypothetical protein
VLHREQQKKDLKQGAIMNIVNLAKQWVTDRIKERTSWDGAVLIAAGGSFILLGPVADVIAYIAIVYGAWTLWKKEGQHILDTVTDKQE